MSTPAVDSNLVTLEAAVDRNVSSYCWKDSESYSYKAKKVADPLEKEMLNVADPQVKEVKATVL